MVGVFIFDVIGLIPDKEIVRRTFGPHVFSIVSTNTLIAIRFNLKVHMREIVISKINQIDLFTLKIRREFYL